MAERNLSKVFLGPANYQITVLGKLDKSFLAYWSNMQLSYSKIQGKPYSILSGQVVDQPALSGILNIITNNRLSIISVLKIDN